MKRVWWNCCIEMDVAAKQFLEERGRQFKPVPPSSNFGETSPFRSIPAPPVNRSTGSGSSTALRFSS